MADSAAPHPHGILVVGASQAGVQLAASVRELGYEAPVRLVGGEDELPYQRPPLSKDCLLPGGDQHTAQPLRAERFYESAGVELLTGTWIEQVRLADPRTGAGTATTRDGRSFAFDRLALTTGGSPRRLDVPGTELSGVCYLRDAEDGRRLRRLLASAGRVVVVGGGFVGLESAAAARRHGAQVTVVEAAARLLERAVAPEVSEFYLHAHRRRGTEVVLGRAVTRVLPRGTTGDVGAVVLDDGSELPADLVVVGIGLVPRTDLAEQLDLACGGGIVVDELARTSIPSVVAAGDCTVQPHPAQPGELVRLESVQNAVSQARVAAATLLGRAQAPEVPWFWSDQGEVKLQIAGVSTGYDRLVLRGDPDTESFSALYYRDDRLIAVDAVNAPRDYLVVRKALATGRSIDAERAADATVSLKQLLDAPAPV